MFEKVLHILHIAVDFSPHIIILIKSGCFDERDFLQERTLC